MSGRVLAMVGNMLFSSLFPLSRWPGRNGTRELLMALKRMLIGLEDLVDILINM